MLLSSCYVEAEFTPQEDCMCPLDPTFEAVFVAPTLVLLCDRSFYRGMILSFFTWIFLLLFIRVCFVILVVPVSCNKHPFSFLKWFHTTCTVLSISFLVLGYSLSKRVRVWVWGEVRLLCRCGNPHGCLWWFVMKWFYYLCSCSPPPYNFLYFLSVLFSYFLPVFLLLFITHRRSR